MTSKLTREENVQAVFDLKAGYTLGLADVEILKRVARMALAAMDSEPAIVVGDDGGDALSYRRLIQSFEPGTKLYRHAQQPVVPDAIPVSRDIDAGYLSGWNDYRAAMLQSGNSTAQNPGWIPVSERMPEKNGTYQVWNGEHVGAVPFLFGSFQCLNPEQVTHWMPTAKPPREVNHG